MKIGVRKVKKISKGNILLEVNSKEDVEKTNLEINTNEKLRELYIVKKGYKLIYKLILYNVINDIETESLIESIKTQNDLSDEAFVEVEFKMKSQLAKIQLLVHMLNILKN